MEVASATARSGSKRIPLAIGLAALGVVGMALVLQVTRDGVDLTSDSIVYINAARNLLAGRGLSRLSGIGGAVPMTHFPPLYSLVLAGLQILGMEAPAAARLVNSLAFGATVALAGGIVASKTASTVYPLVASALVLTSPVLLDINAWAMTEPLFLVLGLAALLSLAKYARERKAPWLWAAAGAAGLAAVTRYAGVALLATGCSTILLLRGRSLRRNARDVSIFLAAAIAPFVAWGLRSVLLTGSATNRALSWHPPDWLQLKRVFGVVWEWMFPGQFTYPALYAMAGVALVAVIAAILACRRKGTRSALRRFAAAPWESPQRIVTQHVVWYSGMLVLTLFAVDATTPIDQRILSPVYVSIIILAVLSLASWDGWARVGWARLAVPALVGAIIISYGARSAFVLRALQAGQRGFTNPGWVSMGTLDAIRDLPSDILIYTNNLEALEFFYGRGGTIIPFSVDAVTRLPVAPYESWLGQMRERLRAGAAVLILFGRRADDVELPSALIQGTELWYEQGGARIYVGPGGTERLGPPPTP
jgi:hypothetical protein